MAGEDPSVSGVSGRYATALFELARDEKSIDAVKSDLDRFTAMLGDSADLTRLVRSPVFSADAQSKALSAVLDKAGISGISANFLKVLTANRRLFAVGDVTVARRKEFDFVAIGSVPPWRTALGALVQQFLIALEQIVVADHVLPLLRSGTFAGRQLRHAA